MQETFSTVDTPKRRSRRSYTKEFKARIVAQCGQGDKSIACLLYTSDAADEGLGVEV